MIRPLRPQSRIRGCVNPRECPELIGEMGLIVEPAIQCQFRPRNIHSRVKQTHCSLKALNPTPDLGSQANILAEDLRKSSLAEPSADRHFTHRRNAGRGVESPQRELHHAVARKARGKPANQKFFQATEPLPAAANLSQPIAERSCRRAPNVLEGHTTIAEQVNGVACESTEAAWLKDDADEVRHVGTVNNFVD